MHISTANLSSNDTAYLLKELQNIVNIRDQMGGSLYFNVCQDDAISIAKRLRDLGVSKETLQKYF